LKLKTWFAAAALAVAAACTGDATGSGSVDIGPPPSLPAGLDTVTTASGLKYVDVAPGAGAVAQAGSQVSLRYTLWLSNGTGIDTSGSTPVLFTLGNGQLIAGFDEGVRGMEVGGKRRLIVPPSLGYGSQPVVDQNTGRVIIPANSTLIFDVELVSIRS
jgi:FKBP-type peptidyl-prolyl cis-trans isomerase FkpA